MKATFRFVFVVALVAMATEARSASVLEKHPIDWYDCSGKADGNYLHPTDCTRFISCSGNVASERDCAACDPVLHPTRCPSEGRLVYSDTDDACLWADETTCKTGNNSTTTESSVTLTTEDITTTDEPYTTTNDYTDIPSTTAAPRNNETLEGKPCNPHNCTTKGYCLHYFRCDLVTKVWVKEYCGKDLLWNPNDASGNPHTHGGNCGDPRKLDKKTLDLYRSDPECLACYWEEIAECSAKYLYQSPELYVPTVQELECDANLVFVKAKETCLRCEDVPKSSGGYCC